MCGCGFWCHETMPQSTLHNISPFIWFTIVDCDSRRHENHLGISNRILTIKTLCMARHEKEPLCGLTNHTTPETSFTHKLHLIIRREWNTSQRWCHFNWAAWIYVPSDVFDPCCTLLLGVCLNQPLNPILAVSSKLGVVQLLESDCWSSLFHTYLIVITEINTK